MCLVYFGSDSVWTSNYLQNQHMFLFLIFVKQKRFCVVVWYLLREMLPATEGLPLHLVCKHLQFILIEELVGDLEDGGMRSGMGREELNNKWSVNTFDIKNGWKIRLEPVVAQKFGDEAGVKSRMTILALLIKSVLFHQPLQEGLTCFILNGNKNIILGLNYSWV